MFYANVIVVKDDVVDENILVTGDTERETVTKKAEAIFLDKCSVCLSNWDEYTQDDIDACLMDGYALFGHGSICMTWPEVKE